MKFIIYLFIAFNILILPAYHNVSALTTDELRKQIELKQQEKQKLEEENRKLEAQIEAIQRQENTLQNTVKTLDTTQKKLQTDIQITRSNISRTELSIQKLRLEIGSKENQIETNKSALAETLRILDQNGSVSTLEALLQFKSINEFWNSIETLQRFQKGLELKISELKGLKTELEGKTVENINKKEELVDYTSQLSGKKVIVEQNKQDKVRILEQTKNLEAEYQAQLQKNIELGKKFEQELFEFESELKVKIDPSKLPTQQSGVIDWPLDKIFVTQKFGKSVDAKRLYVSGTHNGTDFRAVTGSSVKSVYNGTVRATGNTDSQSGCFSYGRWILIDHPNGLSSLYAHLSGINVAPGEKVSTGDLIAYSGGQPGTSGAGFSTGPHLHLGLYATQGVSVERFTKSNFCKQVSIPLSPANAYLDPMAYLPPLP
ncbi:MAG: hypothetical protein CO184_00025 [Candidatus Zambryskibacteria bacterium CG_4_9_14_3_um_filter_40_16]|uniref:M23ase beta-sheet core domain-containing protein n=2 Tax=Candidatus Zambryskiibacteriota TaxID=1817925 RepID=A0A2H0K6Y9_9BACT|nr:MAG: hypothetical protein COV95_01015 [Candidatus Zambryskibacteria bacterium CG11_big_fil_rev_8_21_14_0_20_40_24]PJA34594.1 MAG: hypothetical protein CO184_00025 [Candidatus Zambryskibacteria bacterium CG_4_9_14_3_um_filter_40_16]